MDANTVVTEYTHPECFGPAKLETICMNMNARGDHEPPLLEIHAHVEASTVLCITHLSLEQIVGDRILAGSLWKCVGFIKEGNPVFHFVGSKRGLADLELNTCPAIGYNDKPNGYIWASPKNWPVSQSEASLGIVGA